MSLRVLAKLAILAAATASVGLLAFCGRINSGASTEAYGDASKARAAFTEAAKVFFSPRCVNCHPGGDAPLQGDSSLPHSNDVVRGPKGRGTEDLQCSMCHLDTNTVGEGMPPGVPDWHMPGSEIKMSFQGLTTGQLCRQLKDPLKNGGRNSARDAVEHVFTDPKVIWAWSPGNDRTKPPLARDVFLQKMNDWLKNGADCPN